MMKVIDSKIIILSTAIFMLTACNYETPKESDNFTYPKLTTVEATTTIDVLFLDGAGSQTRELSARQALAVTNTYFSQSQVPLNFNFVGYEAYNDYQKNDMEHSLDVLESHLKDKSSTYYQIRENKRADIVILMAPNFQHRPSKYTCGITSNGFAHHPDNPVPSRSSETLKSKYSYAVISIDPICGDENSQVLAHEIGHILGLAHGNPNDNPHKIGLHSYSKGYAKRKSFSTIMTYAHKWKVSKNRALPIFSNPDIVGCDKKCGVEGQFDAASSIKETMEQIDTIFS